MLNKIIHFSIKNKVVIGLFTLGLVVWGVYSATQLPIDALPDITNNQVQIITTSPTLATQEVEKFITNPIEREVKSIPDVVELRSVSRFGLSLITVVFKEDVDIYWARSQINERLKAAENNVPENFGRPQLAPVSTGLGEIYQYVVFAEKGYEKQYDAMALRTIQDWIIVPQILGTKGVAEVNTLGGLLKEYEVAVEPDRLKSIGVTMSEIFEALEKNNENTGGAYIDKKPNAYYIRGVGMVNSIADIQKIVIKVNNNIPILIRDVAKVRFGSAIRYGATTKDGKGEVVSGMVMMLKGENSAEVVKLVKNKVELIKETLPEGIIIEPFLDRTKLVNSAISTVKTNLIEGALIVIFILVLLIGNWRAGLIVASVIPLALLFAIGLMNWFGVSGNLMSLGAIDFGLIVDGAVIIVEAIIHGLQKMSATHKLSKQEMDDQVYKASSRIRTSAAFGEIIILIVYIPILALVGIEGKMFTPMAQTVSFAILGAFILSLTYVPMMSALFLSKNLNNKITISDKIIGFINRYYQRVLVKALRLKGAIIGLSVLLFVGALILFQNLGGEFIPTLEEGDIATHIIIPPGSSLEQEIETTTKAEQLLMASFPEIEQAVSKIGSAEVATDPMPMEVADLMLIMKPKQEWTSANTKEEMMAKMDEVLAELPGVTTEFTQPIQMRFNELMTGVRSDVGVKIFGENIDLLVGYGDQVVTIIQKIEGVTDVRAETVSGLPQISVNYNKDKLALYGLSVGDLNQMVSMGFAGQKAGVVYEGEKRFDLVVRLESDSRNNIDDIKNMYVSLPSGSQIPLGLVADITLERGPAQISREQGKRRIIVGFNVRNRDVQTIVNEIQNKLKSDLDLPVGYYIEYAGQFENLVEANKRLSIAVPIALIFILVLLFLTFKNIQQALLIFTAIPLAAIGGVFALWIRDMPFSISAGVGFIALFGVAVLNGIVLISYFNYLKVEGMTDIIKRISEGTKVRLRPVIMTAMVASCGFLPMALSTSAGAEVQKPLATVVIGGLITATLLTLIVLPILYYYQEKGLRFKSKFTKSTLLIGLMTVTYTGLSQNKAFTLEEAIKYGLENNAGIKAAKLMYERNEKAIGLAYSIPKTDIKATYGQINSANFDQYYSISQSLNPFLISAKKDWLSANAFNSELQLDARKQDLVLQIRTNWNELLYEINVLRHLEYQDSLWAKFVEQAISRYNAGDCSLLEKTSAELQYSSSKLLKAEVQMEIENHKKILQVLLGLKTNLEFGDELLKKVDFNIQPDSSLLAKNPVLLTFQQRIKVAEYDLNTKQKTLYPDLELGYFRQSFQGYQTVDGIPVLYGSNPNFQGVSIGMSLPIFTKADRTAVKMASITVAIKEEEANYIFEELKQQLGYEIDQLTILNQQIGYYENEALVNADLMVNHALKKYQVGELSYLEYATAVNASFEIRKAYLKSLKVYNQKVYNLKYLIHQ